MTAPPPKAAFFFLPFIALVLIGCDADSSADDSSPAGSTVKILSTSPNQAERLKRGDLVKIHAEVVKRGSGTRSFEAEFVVPDTEGN